MNVAVDRAIRFICEQYDQPLSLADVADSAILSPYHFTRLFKEVTGITPGRYISAVRIYQAKRMLLATEMSITDIVFAVGYNSVGSFSNHFSDSVGLSPGRFRRVSRTTGFRPPQPREVPARAHADVTGRISLPAGYASSRTYIGIFDTPIVQRQPASAAMVEVRSPDGHAPFRLTGVPEGLWHVNAVAMADSADPEPWTRRALLVGGSGQLSLAAGEEKAIAIELRPRRPTDLPILLALPSLEDQPQGVRRG
jgi:AraC family transcriptional regulator